MITYPTYETRNNQPFRSPLSRQQTAPIGYCFDYYRPTPGASSKIANTSIGVPVVASNTRFLNCSNKRTIGGSQQQQLHTTPQSTLLAAVKLLVHAANTISTNRRYNQHLVTFMGFHEHVMHVQTRIPHYGTRVLKPIMFIIGITTPFCNVPFLQTIMPLFTCTTNNA